MRSDIAYHFYVAEKSEFKGVTVFEMELAKCNISHTVGRELHRQQTNDKMEKFFLSRIFIRGWTECIIYRRTSFVHYLFGLIGL
jgi:hypothetical protein